MPHLVRSLVLSLTVLTTLGVGPAATAAPRHTGGAAATAAPDDAVARLRNRLSAQAEAELERLSQTSGDIAFGDLTDDQKSSLVTDIRYDLQNLAALAGSIGEATTVEQLRGLRGDLHEFYPHVYDVAVAYLQDANMLVARVAANDALVPTLREGFAERAQAANDGARDALGTPYVGEISAHHGRADADGLRRAVAGLAAIRAQLRSVTHIVAEERRFRRLQDRLQAQAYEKQLQLSRVRGKVVDSDLTDDEKMAISDAIGHTEHVASELLSSASAATSIEQLRGVAYGLDPIYPHAYDVLLALAEQEPGLRARIAANAAALAAVTDRDVSAGVTANAAAAAALVRATEVNLGDDPTKAGADEVRDQLSIVHRQLRTVRRVLGAHA